MKVERKFRNSKGKPNAICLFIFFLLLPLSNGSCVVLNFLLALNVVDLGSAILMAKVDEDWNELKSWRKEKPRERNLSAV